MLRGRGDGSSTAERRSLGADRRAALLQRCRDVRRSRRCGGDGDATRARRSPSATARPPSAFGSRSTSTSGATSTGATCARAGSGARTSSAKSHPLRSTGRCAIPTKAVRSVDREDARVDSSLLGLAWPFRAVDPTSPRMRATIEAVERELRLDDGGVLRHQDDDYAGGNPWLISTLWLGLAERQAGDDAGHRASLEYALARQTPLGLLPEQVTRDGEPAWVGSARLEPRDADPRCTARARAGTRRRLSNVRADAAADPRAVRLRALDDALPRLRLRRRDRVARRRAASRRRGSRGADHGRGGRRGDRALERGGRRRRSGCSSGSRSTSTRFASGPLGDATLATGGRVGSGLSSDA